MIGKDATAGGGNDAFQRRPCPLIRGVMVPFTMLEREVHARRYSVSTVFNFLWFCLFLVRGASVDVLVSQGACFFFLFFLCTVTVSVRMQV